MFLRISVDTFTIIFCTILFLIGISLRYWINRRKFNRRNMVGLEGFKNYEQSVFIGLLERIGKIIAWILIIVGFVVGTFSYFARDKESSAPTEQIEKPVR